MNNRAIIRISIDQLLDLLRIEGLPRGCEIKRAQIDLVTDSLQLLISGAGLPLVREGGEALTLGLYSEITSRKRVRLD